MIRYARLTPGPGWQPARAVLYYAQRAIIWCSVRRCIAFLVAKAIRVLHRSRRLHMDEIINQFARDGYVMLPPLLVDTAIAEMLAYLEGKDVVLRDGRVVSVDAVPVDQPLANFPLSTVVNCPHTVELANHPRLLQLAAAYLGCTPTISTIGLRWSYPSQVVDGVEQFHRDTDDWSSLKFFLYLTDVDEMSGPHVFIPRSHLDNKDLFCRSYRDDEVARRCCAVAPVSVVGPRGAMFLSNTDGLHKGAVPLRHPRLVFQVGYSLLPVFALRYEPVRLTRDRPPFDRYINRLIIEN